jgi:hypothetical protein
MAPATPRPTPCASCPYRQNVPSGIWAREEYDKLPAYDRETFDQPAAAFMCHQQDGCVCAGWLGHADPTRLLAVRLGLSSGNLDPTCADYQTDVPLFPTGAAAANHGTRDINGPRTDAVATMTKLLTSRAHRRPRHLLTVSTDERTALAASTSTTKDSRP